MRDLAELLAPDGVVEDLVPGSGVGVMAFHGGDRKVGTDLIADAVAARTGASLYPGAQTAGLRHRHAGSTPLSVRALRAARHLRRPDGLRLSPRPATAGGEGLLIANGVRPAERPPASTAPPSVLIDAPLTNLAVAHRQVSTSAARSLSFDGRYDAEAP